MEILKVSSAEFKKEVLESEIPVLVDFYADWCGPCKMMSPILEEVAKDMQDKIKICKVNIDENIKLAEKYNIMSIPTIAVFEDGKIKNKCIGLIDKEEIIKLI